MHSHIRTAIALALLAISVTGAGAVYASSTNTRAGTVACAIQYIKGTQHCYDPAQVRQAEHQVPIAIRPSATVRSVLHLSLAQVTTYRPYAGTQRAASISYLYGVLRSDYGRAPGNPTSLVITESAQSYTAFTPKYTRTVAGARFELSPAALDHPYRSYGPWYLVGNFAHHHASFTITANVPQSRLLQLATALRQQG